MDLEKPSSDTVVVVEPGVLDYAKAHELQLRLVQARVEGLLPRDVLLLLQHTPVYTIGRRGGKENLLVSEAVLKDLGIPMVQVERGGNITYHGPGQLVGYPIFDLRGRAWGLTEFVAALEEVMIGTARDWGVRAERHPLSRGVWVGGEKLGSIGIALRRWISFHGFALNVNVDLAPFSRIHPCGLQGVPMTSIARVLGQEIPMAKVCDTLIGHVDRVLGTRLEGLSRDDFAGLMHRITRGVRDGTDEERFRS